MFITNISSSSPYLNVTSYQGSKPYISPGSQSAGMMRYNTNSQNMEVYDGVSWQTLGMGNATIELTPVVQTAVTWVLEQMSKESKMRELAKSHGSIQAALDNVEKAKLELELIYELAKDHTE